MIGRTRPCSGSPLAALASTVWRAKRSVPLFCGRNRPQLGRFISVTLSPSLSRLLTRRLSLTKRQYSLTLSVTPSPSLLLFSRSLLFRSLVLSLSASRSLVLSLAHSFSLTHTHSLPLSLSLVFSHTRFLSYHPVTIGVRKEHASSCNIGRECVVRRACIR